MLQQRQHTSYIRLSVHLSPPTVQGDIDAIILFRLDGKQYQVLDRYYDESRNIYEVYLQFNSVSSARTGLNLLKITDIEGCKFDAWLEDANCLGNSKILEQVYQELESYQQEFLVHKRLLLEAHENKRKEVQAELKICKGTTHRDVENFGLVLDQIDTLNGKVEQFSKQENEFTQVCDNLQKILSQLTRPKSFQGFRSDLNKVKKIFQLESHFFDGALPIYAYRTEIVDVIDQNKACVILADTGSGKSTQMVQYLYQANFCESGIIICTQPRKVAAVSLARHVSQLMGSSVGQLVGYEVGMSVKKSDLTKILYMTDSQFLNFCLANPSLKGVSVVIVDEAHERSLNSDLLLSIVRNVAIQRMDLKVVITSATIDPKKFTSYFNNCPVVKVPGRTFPVEVQYLNDQLSSKDFVERSVQIVHEIHENETDGDILVFVTTPQEVENACILFKEAEIDSILALPLHGRLQVEEQQKVFVDTPGGKRKVVYATNAAETSITIPGIRYVVDTGLAKEKQYDPRRNVSRLVVGPICKSSADQRKGRAGRTLPGKCYRMYSGEDYDTMEKEIKPEILRCHLGQAMLKLLELGFGDPLKFEFVEAPDRESLEKAMEMLKYLGAVDDNGITEAGLCMAKFPLEPRLAKLVLCSLKYELPFEGIVTAAMVSHSSGLFFRRGTAEEIEMADKCKLQFCQPLGDMMTYLGLYSQWSQVEEKQKTEWCVANCLSARCLRSVRDLVKEVMTILTKCLSINIKYEFLEQDQVVHGLQMMVLECYGKNVAVFTGNPMIGYIALDICQQVRIHPSSAIRYLGSNYNPQFIVYDLVLTTTDDYILNIMPVDPSILQEAIDSGFIDQTILENVEWDYSAFSSVGPLIVKKFIGPGGSNIKALQEEMRQLLGTLGLSIRASVPTGELVVCYPRESAEKAEEFIQEKITEFIKVEKANLVGEVVEIPVEENFPSNPSLILLGRGGAVEDILQPDEYRSVRVHGVSEDFTVDLVKARFSEFGSITKTIKFKRKKDVQYYGDTYLVTFMKAADAEKAVMENRKIRKEYSSKTQQEMDEEEDVDLLAIVSVEPGRKIINKMRNKPFSKVTVSWLRRTNRGFGFVEFGDYNTYQAAAAILIGKKLHCTKVYTECCLMNNCATFKNGKKPMQIFIQKLPNFIDNETLKSSVEALLPPDIRPTYIKTPHDKPFEHTKELHNSLTRCFQENIRGALPEAKVTLDLHHPKKETVHYVTDIFCRTAQESQVIVQLFSQMSSWKVPTNFGTCNAHVVFNVDFNSTFEIHCSSKLFEKMKKKVERLQQELNRNRNAHVKFSVDDQTYHGRVIVMIDSKDSMLSYNAVNEMNKLLSGKTMSCERDGNEVLGVLFTHTGQKRLQMIAERTGCIITSNQFTYSICIHGDDAETRDAENQIQRYKQDLRNCQVVELPLTPPIGTARMMVRDYEPTLEGLLDATGAANLCLNVATQTLGVTGTNEAINKVKQIILECGEKAKEDALAQEPDSVLDMDCLLCGTAIEQSLIYRLEYCGHAYHRDCIAPMLTLDDPDIPFTCPKEDCGEPLVIPDLTQLLGKLQDANNIKRVAVRRFLINNKNYVHCPAPNCPNIIKPSLVTPKTLCSGCGNNICTICKTLYHEGLSCELSHLLANNKDFRSWVARDPNNRKICRGCGCGIEKTGGCNHVFCLMCKSHFCWICDQSFQSDNECYAHLREKHGGIG